MGWKASMIIINSDEAFDKDEFFESIGYYDLKKVDKQYFETVINPEDERIYLGQFKGNTVICMQDLPIESMDQSLSRAEANLSSRFPDTDIVTFILHSVVNLWGYSIVNNGKKIRVRVGSSEGGTQLEYGDVLEEEKELFSKSKTNEKGERVFVFEDMPEDEFQDDQVGENFVFDLSKKYFGESLDRGDVLFETELEGCSFSRERPAVKKPVKVAERKSAPPPKKAAKKPWWKFWG